MPPSLPLGISPNYATSVNIVNIRAPARPGGLRDHREQSPPSPIESGIRRRLVKGQEDAGDARSDGITVTELR